MSYDFFQDSEGGQGIGGLGIATIVILFAIAIFVFIFVGSLTGTVYSVVEPKISSVSVSTSMTDDSFVAVNGTGVSLDNDRIIGTVVFVLDK